MKLTYRSGFEHTSSFSAVWFIGTWLLAVSFFAASPVPALQPEEEKKKAVKFMPEGTTGHSWGAWVTPGATVEDWVARARPLCGEEDLCQVNVFEGPEYSTHVNPVPEENLPGLKWVLTYRHNDTPRVVVEEVRAEPGKEKRTWTFDE